MNLQHGYLPIRILYSAVGWNVILVPTAFYIDPQILGPSEGSVIEAPCHSSPRTLRLGHCVPFSSHVLTFVHIIRTLRLP